jgi:hypothetical protein
METKLRISAYRLGTAQTIAPRLNLDGALARASREVSHGK